MKNTIKCLCYALVLISFQSHARDIKVYHTGASVDLKFYTYRQYENNPILSLDRNFTLPSSDGSGLKYNVSMHYDQTPINYSRFLISSAKNSAYNGEYYILGMTSIVCSSNGLAEIQKIATDAVLGIINEKNRKPASRRNYKILVMKYPTIDSPTSISGSCNNITDQRNLKSTANAYNAWVDQQIKSHGWKNLVYAVAPWKNNFETLTEGNANAPVHIHPLDSAINVARKRVHECIKSVENGRNNGACDNNSPHPSSPSNLWASNITQNSVKLNWKASTSNIGIKEYEVLQNGRKVGSTKGTSIFIKNLSPNVNYSFRVRTKDAVGRLSGFSNYETAVTNAAPVSSTPATPTPLTPKGSITNRTPTYRWKAVPGAKEYYLWSRDSSGKVLFKGVTASAAGCANGTNNCWLWDSRQLSYGNGRWHVIAGNDYKWGAWSAASNYTVR